MRLLCLFRHRLTIKHIERARGIRYVIRCQRCGWVCVKRNPLDAWVTKRYLNGKRKGVSA